MSGLRSLIVLPYSRQANSAACGDLLLDAKLESEVARKAWYAHVFGSMFFTIAGTNVAYPCFGACGDSSTTKSKKKRFSARSIIDCSTFTDGGMVSLTN
jgi:hypothetical protein